MTSNQPSRTDRKEGRSRQRTVSEHIEKKDISLRIYLPGSIKGATESTKLNQSSLIRIWIADNPHMQTMPYWKVERAFKKLSKRQQENIAKKRKWFFKIDEQPPAEYQPIPYFHIPRQQSEALKVLHLSDEQVAGFIDRNNKPAKFQRKDKQPEWERMTERQRLVFHFKQIAEGCQYSWEYVE